MLLTSGTFFIFLILVFFAYWLIAGRVQWRIPLLAAASYFFYAQSGITPVLLLLAISTIDFLTTRAMAKVEQQRSRRLLLLLSLTIDIGTLCLFKYADFFLTTAANGLALAGAKVHFTPIQLIVPMGISFFIFQSIAYVIDVYRKDIK